MNLNFLKFNLGSNPSLSMSHYTRGRGIFSQDVTKVNFTLDFIKLFASLMNLAKQKDGITVFIVSCLLHSKKF